MAGEAGGMTIPALTDDEIAILTLAVQGESMAAIGRWEKPTEHLVELGLMERGDKFNNFITAAGRAALDWIERAEDEAFDRALRRGPVIEGAAGCPL